MTALTLADVNNTLVQQNDNVIEGNKKLDILSSKLSSFLEAMKSESLKRREEAIEGGSSTPEIPEVATAGLFGGIGAALAGLGGVLGTVILGFTGAILASFDETFNDISRTFAAAWLGVGKKLRSFINMFTAKGVIGGAIARLIDGIRGPAKVFDEAAERWRNIKTGRFMKTPTVIARALDKVADVFNGIGGFFSRMFGEQSTFGKAFTQIKSAFTFAEDSKVLSLLKGFGAILKKIFLPIGLIFTAYDTVKGAFEGYEEGGFVGALTGAVSGLLSSIIGAPLNLIKEIGLWVAKQFGLSDEDADKLSKAMDFEQIIKDFGKTIANLINSAIEWITNFDIGEAIGEAWEKLTTAVSGDQPDLTPSQQAEQDLAKIPGMTKLIEEGGVEKARETVREDYSGRRQEQILAMLDKLEDAPRFYDGTLGVTGKLFPDFGKGTLAILDGQEAVVPKDSPEGQLLQATERPKKISTQAMPKSMGNTLGQIMGQFQDSGIMQMAQQRGAEMKAKEEAMRAAGASDMDIAKAMMPEVGGLMGSLKGASEKLDFSSIQQPKMKSNPIREALQPNNIGNTFGAIVREAEENKENRAAQPAVTPVVISDNSSKMNTTSNTAMPVISKPFDFEDPFVSGIGRTRGL